MAFSIRNKNLKGCLFGAPNPRDYKTVFKDTPVPDKVDLRPNCTMVENQGELGSCTANAAVGALEYLYTVRDGQAPQLSRLFVYFNARRMRGAANVDSGAYISDAMASVMAFGACREETWPYVAATFTTEPSRVAYDEAMNYEAIQYSRVDAVDGSVQALAAGFPVVFGARIPARCYEEAAKTGVMPVPSEQEVQTNQEGGHCMLIVGYDNPARMFIVRNSWGESWGDRGYCRIPYDVFNMCAPRDCFWIIGELEKPGNYTLVRPGRVAARPTAAPPAPAVPTTARSSGLAEKAAKMREEIRSSLDAEIDASSKRIEKILSSTTGDKKSAGEPTSRDIRKPIALSKQKFGDQYVCPNCGYVSSSPGACPYCSSGAKPAVYGAPCGKCLGTGRCIPHYPALEDLCPNCSGTNKCWMCNGTGQLPDKGFAPTKQKFGAEAPCPMCGRGLRWDEACPSCSFTCDRCGVRNEVKADGYYGSGRSCGYCRDCSLCQGTKYCVTCQGAGGALVEGCEACRNTGKCEKCDGKGWERDYRAPVPETVKAIALTKQKFGDQYVCPNCGYVSNSPGACPYCSSGSKPAVYGTACLTCGGTGKCSIHRGEFCPTCLGTNTCNVCNGTGQVPESKAIALTKQKFGDQYVCPNCGYVSSSPGACPYCSGEKPAARR